MIEVGGVFTAEDAQRKLDLGADLVQVLTGLVYQRPSIAYDIKKALIR